MKTYETDKIRNVAFIGHSGDGKTSLVEAILYVTGKNDRLGKVDDGSSLMDYEPEEIKRKISISSSLNFCEWKKCKINIIDTPGESNFIFDTRNCMRAADMAILLIDATSGPKVQTERVWQFVNEYNIPVAVFISRMDRERADFTEAISKLNKFFDSKFVPLQIPIGKEAGFKGFVDLLNMKAVTFSDDLSGKPQRDDIPDELQDEAQSQRETLIEDIAESADELLEKYLDGQELTQQELIDGMRSGFVNREFIPVLCGAGTKNIGIPDLLDFIVDIGPTPLDHEPFKAVKQSDDSPLEVKTDPEGPFMAQVFKTVADPYAGKLTLFKVISGSVKSDTNILNLNKSSKERTGQIFLMEGKKQQPAQVINAGDIAAMAKLKETTTDDTLGADNKGIIFSSIETPSPLISFSAKAKEKGDEDKLSSAIHRLIEEDPTLRFHRDEQTREWVLAGMGQLHVEVTLEKLKRKFGVEVTLGVPKVPYKETIKGKSKGQGKYKKQTGGRGQYGDTWLEVEPMPSGEGFEFVDKIVGGVIPRQYIPAVEKGIVEAMAEGIMAGYPVTDIRVTLYDGSFHQVDSSEMAFKIAASMGFKKIFMEAQPVLLEPIVVITVIVPDDNVGDVIGDLNSRRGRVLGVEPKVGYQEVKAQVPMAEVLKYSPDLESMTGGRGTFVTEFSHYEEVPGQIAEKIIEQNKE